MPAIKAAIWVHDILKGLGLPQPLPIRIKSDSTNAITNANEPHFGSKIRHMDIKYKWIKEQVARCIVEPVYVSTTEMVLRLGQQVKGITIDVRSRKFKDWI